ncbi:MAG: benzoate-CoA ligase family protein, partial [Acidobacteria bacterium]|nr:benzoate-CoA ligase family protein [Acidobacteriota bacterium]
HEAVEECAVVVEENSQGLGKPVAFVRTLAPTFGLEETLKAFVLAALAPYKHPRRVFFLDDFPRTHLGKIDRKALKVRLSS